MSNFDWSTFSLKIYIDAPKQVVYNSWAIPQNLEGWFLREANFSMADGKYRPKTEQVCIGDTYEWKWHGYCDNVCEHGTILETNGSDCFKFQFGKAGLVSVFLKEVKGKTELILKQENIPTDDKSKADYHVGCSTGWTFYFANLKSILEGGLDLRNKDPELTNVINS